MVARVMAVLLLMVCVGLVVWGGQLIFQAAELRESMTHLDSPAAVEARWANAYDKFGQAFAMLVIAGFFGVFAQMHEQLDAIRKAISMKRLLPEES